MAEVFNWCTQTLSTRVFVVFSSYSNPRGSAWSNFRVLQSAREWKYVRGCWCVYMAVLVRIFVRPSEQKIRFIGLVNTMPSLIIMCVCVCVFYM